MSESERDCLPSDKLMLTIAIKLYARARKISIDDAEDNVRDAAMMTLEAEGRQEASK